MTDHLRYVTHIDILGMTALVKKDAELAWQVLSGLAMVRNHVHNIEIEIIATGQRTQVVDRIFSVMFSDTIVLFTMGDTEIDLKLILIATSELLHKAMFNRVPVRAGIAHGTFFFNIQESMYAGPALIEAYHLGESAQWLGITTSETVCRRAKVANIQSGTVDVVIPAQIPSRSGMQCGYAVNWPASFAHDFKVEPPISVELFYSQFAESFGPLAALSAHDQQKYINTTRFINACLQRT